MSAFNVAVIVGSLRKESWSLKLAKSLASLAPNLQFTIVPIGDLPHYNEELEAKLPAAYSTFRDAIRAADAVLFITPEYNRSVPGALKNAIDVGSRPYGKAVWNKKPGAVISVSQGAAGGFGANHHLRQSLVFLDVPTLQQPEAYIGAIQTKFKDDGKLVADFEDYIKSILSAFESWIAQQKK